MDVLLRHLRSALRRPPARLLAAGRLPESLELGAGEEVRAPRLDDPALAENGAEKGELFDLVLWRLGPSWHEGLLARAATLLTERGRLWLIAPANHRRRLVLDLGRVGFAVLGEHRSGDLMMIEARHDGFTVRAYEPGDEEEILRLFTPAFHVARSLEHWRWKYLENPWGQALITVAHSPEGELAAHYAGYPVPFYLASSAETLLGLQIGDTMTDPRFRRAGRGVSSLLGRCFRHFFARNCDERVAFNYGFNTGNIRRFNFQFIKGRLGQQVTLWRRAASPSVVADSAYRAQAVSLPGRDFDRFFRRVAPAYRFLVRRDAAWLTWRFLACPDDPPFQLLAVRRRRKLVGWGVFRRRRSAEVEQLLWVDALFDPRHAGAAEAVLSAALENPALGGASEVVAWFPPRPAWWHRQVESLGFEQVEEPNDLALIYLPFTRPEADRLLPEAYYTMGDSDLA